MHVGRIRFSGGRIGEPASFGLSAQLKELGFEDDEEQAKEAVKKDYEERREIMDAITRSDTASLVTPRHLPKSATRDCAAILFFWSSAPWC